MNYVGRKACELQAWDQVRLPGERLLKLVVCVTSDPSDPGSVLVETLDGVSAVPANDLVDVEAEA